MLPLFVLYWRLRMIKFSSLPTDHRCPRALVFDVNCYHSQIGIILWSLFIFLTLHSHTHLSAKLCMSCCYKTYVTHLSEIVKWLAVFNMLWLHGLTSNGQHMWGFLLHKALLFFYQKEKEKIIYLLDRKLFTLKLFLQHGNFLENIYDKKNSFILLAELGMTENCTILQSNRNNLWFSLN